MKEYAPESSSAASYLQMFSLFSEDGEPGVAGYIAKNMKSFARLNPPDPVPARWTVKSPDGRLVGEIKSETTDLAWDRACQPSRTRNDLQAAGWEAVEL